MSNKIILKYENPPWVYKSQREILSDIEYRILLGYVASHYFALSDVPLVDDLICYCNAFSHFYNEFDREEYERSRYADCFNVLSDLMCNESLRASKSMSRKVRKVLRELPRDEFNAIYETASKIAINPEL